MLHALDNMSIGKYLEEGCAVWYPAYIFKCLTQAA